jgi:hypothetical protein
MALPTLADLLTIPSQSDVLDQEVTPELQSRKVRVTDWIEGGVYRAMAYVVSKMRVDVRQVVAALAAAGFEDYVFGFAPLPATIPAALQADVLRWAPLVAKQRYGLDQILATYTKRRITLTNSTATPYGPLSPGAIRVAFPSGNRYILDETITIPANGSVTATFRSEFTTDSKAGRVYSVDTPGSTITLVTANFPGVTATNPAPTFSAVAKSGSGVGLVTPSGAPNGSYSVAVRIDATGTVAGASVQWSTSINGGAFVPRSGSSVVNVEGTGITITLSDNGGDPAFVVGAVYYFQTPGSDITVVGRDEETPQELGARCRGMWPLLALVKDASGNFIPISPTVAGYEVLARNASDQVKVVFVTTGTVNNEVRIVVAGQGALLPGDAIAAVANYFASRNMVTDRPSVLSASTRSVLIGGNAKITVALGQRAAAQQALQRSLALYLGSVDPKKPLGVNGLIERAYIVSLIVNTPFVKRFDGEEAMTLQASGGPPAAVDDLQLPVVAGALELPTWSQNVATTFNWQEE